MKKNPYSETLAVHTERAAPQLALTSFADRAAAVTATQAAITLAVERERDVLAHAVEMLMVAKALELERAVAAAEATRQQLQAAIMKQAFGDAETLPAGIIAEFRREPSRTLSSAFISTWARLSARAELELGEALNWHVLGQLLCDSILSDVPGAASVLADVHFGGNQFLMSSLYAAIKPLATLAEVQAALTTAESFMVHTANAHAGDAVTDEARARHAMRRACATHGDLARAQEAYTNDPVRQAAAAAAIAASQLPMGGSLGDAIKRRLGLLDSSPA